MSAKVENGHDNDDPRDTGVNSELRLLTSAVVSLTSKIDTLTSEIRLQRNSISLKVFFVFCVALLAVVGGLSAIDHFAALPIFGKH